MNMLTEPLPTTLHVGNEDIPIDTDFRTFICYENAMAATDLSAQEKLEIALLLFFGDRAASVDVETAIPPMLEFARCGKPQERRPQPPGSGRFFIKAYDYEHDAGYIYAAFMAQYRIDLCDIPYLHWWKFRALLESLTEEHVFTKIMGYRTMEIDPKLPKKQRDFYTKMKKMYALPIDTGANTDEIFAEAIGSIM